MRHINETFWWEIWWDIFIRYCDETLDGTFWWDILMRHFFYTCQWDTLMAGNDWKFVLNITKLVIKLLNCTAEFFFSSS